MNKFLIILLLSLFVTNTYGQDNAIHRRLILIGDAGEQNIAQESLLRAAAEQVLQGKTTVFFLGDNIYPTGMGLENPDKSISEDILRSQYVTFREKNADVYFLPGNHDWDRSGPQGLQKILAQEQFIQQQQDSQLHFIPQAGTMGPEVVELAPGLVAFLFDSEYWLFPHHQKSISEISDERMQFLNRLDSLLQVYNEDTVLLMCHHPMQSFGEHSLKFSWRQHIFPLTSKWKNFYLPLPIVGSMYPLLRSTVFRSAEDLPHPVYQEMIASLREISNKHPNSWFVSGHDHGLQYIEKGNTRQIVSGSGSKTSAIKKGKGLKYHYKRQGFCILDYNLTGSLHIQFYTYDKGIVHLDFENTKDLNSLNE